MWFLWGTNLEKLFVFVSKRNEADPKGLVSFLLGCRRVVGRLRQSSASLHPPSGTSFLREPLTRPRPATLCRSLPATTQLFPSAVRAEKNRRCHFLVTKRPQLKRYPRLVELYFRKLVRNNFFVSRRPLIFTKSLRMPDWKSAVP